MLADPIVAGKSEQVRAPLGGAELPLLPPPGSDPGMVTGEQHVGDLPAPEHRGAGVLGFLEESIGPEGLEAGRIRVPHHAGEKAHHAFDGGEGRHLSPGEDEVPQGGFFVDEMLCDPFVHPLVAAAHERDRRERRPAIQRRLCQRSPRRGEQDTVGTGERIEGCGERFDHEHHAGAPAERAVVHLPVGPESVRPQIHDLEREPALVEGAADDPEPERSREAFRKEGDHGDAHPPRVSPGAYRRLMPRWFCALLAGVWLLATAAPAAAGVAGDCVVTFNGVEVERIDGLASPLELDAGDRLVFSGTSPGGTAVARVALLAGPVVIDSASTRYPEAAGSFEASIDLAELAPYTVGLLRVRGEADGCSAEAWLRITGRLPVATLAGLTGAGLALAGVAAQSGAIASRRRFSWIAAATAGVVTGTGAAVLGQQFGRLQPSYWGLGGSIAAAAVAGAALSLLAGRARARRRSRERRADTDAGSVIPHDRTLGGTARPVAAATPARDAGPAGVAPVPAAVAAPAPAPDTPPPVPYWGYVLSEVTVVDLNDHSRVVGALHPGTWYLVRREVGPWVHIAATPGPEGWAPRHAVNRQG